jgi:hypothetical protein
MFVTLCACVATCCAWTLHKAFMGTVHEGCVRSWLAQVASISARVCVELKRQVSSLLINFRLYSAAHTQPLYACRCRDCTITLTALVSTNC